MDNQIVYTVRCQSEEQKDEIKKNLKIVAVRSERTIADIILDASRKLKKEN